MNEKIFANGLKAEEKKLEWGTILQLNIKVDEFTAFLKQHQSNGWLTIDIKNSKKGTKYGELNTFKPKAKVQEPKPADASLVPQIGDLPF